MLKARKLGAVLCVVTVLSLSTAAQGAEQFLSVGTDSDGVPFQLDTQTMGKRDRKFGEVLKIYQLKNDSMFEYMLHASCGDEKLRLVGYRVYNANGKQISEEREHRELPARGDAPSSTAMEYYCKSIGARGW